MREIVHRARGMFVYCIFYRTPGPPEYIYDFNFGKIKERLSTGWTQNKFVGRRIVFSFIYSFRIYCVDPVSSGYFIDLSRRVDPAFRRCDAIKFYFL